MNAAVTDDMVATLTTVEQFFTGTGSAYCNGTQVGSDVNTPGSATHDVKNSTNSATTTYILDINPLTVTHTVSPTTIIQGSSVAHDITITAGSTSRGYTASAQASGPASIGPSTATGTFADASAPYDGIADTVSLVSVASLTTNGSTPLGLYTDTAKVASTDLCATTWGGTGEIASSSSRSFTVGAPPPEFDVDANVFAPLGGSNYETVQCVNTTTATGKGNQGKVLSSPGTVHAAAILNFGGGIGVPSMSGVTIKITLPSDFSFDLNGRSPAVHVFAGPTPVSFDANSGAPLIEFAVAPNKITIVGKTVTVDLSELNIGHGAGVFLAGETIYARAHARATTDGPAGNLTFSTEATATAYGGNPLSSTATATVAQDNPACVNGKLPE